MILRAIVLLMGALAFAACGADSIAHGGTGGSAGTGGGGSGGGGGGGAGGVGGGGGGGGGGTQTGCEGQGAGCYTVYAHGDHVLYSIDLMAKTLVTVGPFNAPKVGSNEDVITDLAVGPDNTIYVVSKTNLYTPAPPTGTSRCSAASAPAARTTSRMTSTPDGKLVVGDFQAPSAASTFRPSRRR